MLVQFQIADFIDRAAGVYGDRIGVVDEPDQPAGSHGEVTYREIDARAKRQAAKLDERSEEHTSELQSLMRISYAVFCLKIKQETHKRPSRVRRRLSRP